MLVATWSRLWIRFSRSYFYFLFPSLCFFCFCFLILSHPFSHFLFFFSIFPFFSFPFMLGVWFLFFPFFHLFPVNLPIHFVPSPHPILSEPYPTCPTYGYPSPLPQSSPTEPEGRKKIFSTFGKPLESRRCMEKRPGPRPARNTLLHLHTPHFGPKTFS